MRTTGRFIMAAAVAVILQVPMATGGNLDPTNAPGPTMHTLEEIYQELLTTRQEVAANQERLAGIEQRMASQGMQTTAGNMVLIPEGSYVMGSATNAGIEGISGALPQHTVSISAFYIDKYEVTKGLWNEVYVWATNKGYSFENAGSGKTNEHPVHTVNWFDAVKWCNARSERDGFAPCYMSNGVTYKAGHYSNVVCNWSAPGYRLPTDAEWEKAARGGVAGRRFTWGDGNTILHARANYFADSASYTYDVNTTYGTHPAYSVGGNPYTSPVGSFAPNGYGLYDMTGNIYEWCWDWYDINYYLSSPAENPTGPASPLSFRVQRGGSWASPATFARCAARAYNDATTEFNYVGFRSVRKP